MNIFNVLNQGKSRMNETSMSAMLAYLLNPNQDHGLGNKFLKSFLELANNNHIYNIFLQELHKFKFELDLEVQYFSGNSRRYDIDLQIKILDKDNQELHRIIIENKVKPSAANPEQLKNYFNVVMEKDHINDDLFELEKENLSVIFLTPAVQSKNLEQEFQGLTETTNKVWLYWNSELDNELSIVGIIQSLLAQENQAKISPINEYMRHTLKAFAYFINESIIKSSSKNRLGEDIGDPSKESIIKIGNDTYRILLRDSGQIQLFDEYGEKVIARPLLRKFLEENNIPENDKCQTTRCFGKQIFDFMNKGVN